MELQKPAATPLVTVVCTTYNHEQFIAQTIDGFLAQQCSHPWQILIHDDASTDGTARIVAQYAAQHPDQIRTILQTENQHSQGVDIWQNLFVNHSQSKYIAICEGDDYWTDPLKLQKQIDYMESRPACGLTYTSAQTYVQQRAEFGAYIGWPYVSVEAMVEWNPVVTLTSMFVRQLYVDYARQINPIQHGWKMGDYPLWLYIALHSKIKFLDEVTAIYRVLPNSASHSTDRRKQLDFALSACGVKLFFAQRYLPQMVDPIRLEVLFLWLHYGCNVLDRKLVRQTRRAIRQMSGVTMTGKQRGVYIASLFPWLCRTLLTIRQRTQERAAIRNSHKNPQKI